MSQKSVEIYTWSTCPYCMRAKQLLDSKGVNYTEYSIDGDDVGGCDDLYSLEGEGELDDLLGI